MTAEKIALLYDLARALISLQILLWIVLLCCTDAAIKRISHRWNIAGFVSYVLGTLALFTAAYLATSVAGLIEGVIVALAYGLFYVLPAHYKRFGMFLAWSLIVSSPDIAKALL